MEVSFTSAVVILLLVADPFGNIPVFVALLSKVDPARRVRVVVRECAIAFAVLIAFMLFGQQFLDLLGLSDRALNIAGGVILFLIALRMVFRDRDAIFGELPEGEPFIVPLAIPSIAGPAAIATVILLVSRAPHRMLEWTIAISVAMAASMLVLLFAERIARLVGERGLYAFERLMGLILTAVAVEMLLHGIEAFVKQFPAG
jgi:MarC family membrane protein